MLSFLLSWHCFLLRHVGEVFGVSLLLCTKPLQGLTPCVKGPLQSLHQRRED